MAREIIWTISAGKDLEYIFNYIKKDSLNYARSVVVDIRSATLSLADFAERGRLVPEYKKPDIRELFVGSYRLIYKVGARTIYILALVHGARKLKH